jgi:hypothetical protein
MARLAQIVRDAREEDLSQHFIPPAIAKRVQVHYRKADTDPINPEDHRLLLFVGRISRMAHRSIA